MEQFRIDNRAGYTQEELDKMNELFREMEQFRKNTEGYNQEQKELSNLDDLIGEKWFFRTVTYHLVGRITKRIGNFFLIEGASWVADSGRFMNALNDGTLKEVEPVGRALINIDAITDCFPWEHALPKEQK